MHDQDRALAENSKALPGDPGSSTGPGEHLVSADRAVVAARRILLNMVDALQKGTEPAAVQDPNSFRVRAISKLTPPIDTFDKFVEVYGAEFVPPASVELGHKHDEGVGIENDKADASA